MSDFVTVTHDGVTVIVRKPNPNETNEGLIIYNKVFRRAIEANVLLRQELNDFLIKKGIWNEEKEKQYEAYIIEIGSKENAINKGNISLKEAKKLALEIKKLRNEFRNLISERTTYDNNTAEGVADNARFDYYVSSCILDPVTKKPVFKDMDDYNNRSTEDWVAKAAAELAGLIYGLDPQFENNLPENQFLSKYKFIDKEGRFINKDGHPVAIDENGVERLVDSDGNFIAYDDNGNSRRVNRDGSDYVPPAPFLDDDGNPVEIPAEPAE